MPLTPEQLKELKAQLKEQINSLPQDKKTEAEAHIDSMSPESIEEMLKQQQQSQIFRLIVEKKIPSAIIQENDEAMAVLEINPLSKAHALVIPKNPITKKEDITKKTKQLAEEICQKIKTHLAPKNIKILPNTKFNEIIIDIIPEYDNLLDLNSKRQQTSKEELEELSKKLNMEIIKQKEKPKIIKQEKPIRSEPLKRQRRIP